MLKSLLSTGVRRGLSARSACLLALTAAVASPLWGDGVANGYASPQATDMEIAPGANLGMWVWHAEPVFDADERDALLAFSQRYGIKRLFVQVRFEEDSDGYQMKNPAAWEALISQAREKGIRIEALDGAGDMGFAVNREDTLAKLDAVLDFQSTLPEGVGLSGFHYDIEPYVTERWRTGDKQAVALELLETMQEIRDRVKAADPALTITHDIPFWYSGRDELTVEFDGRKKYLDEHIQDLSDGIGIMSYRTKMTGGNSVVAISQEELDYARDNNGAVYLSLETVPLGETPNITFHGREGGELVEAVRELYAAMAEDKAFGGINLHCYRTLRPMLDGMKSSAKVTN